MHPHICLSEYTNRRLQSCEGLICLSEYTNKGQEGGLNIPPSPYLHKLKRTKLKNNLPDYQALTKNFNKSFKNICKININALELYMRNAKELQSINQQNTRS